MSAAVETPHPEPPERADQDRRRRQPVQARSRETVERILDATAALIDEGGVDAVTTRAVAQRAGITAPSLYRFFADREQIIDELVRRHLVRLQAFVAVAEQDWTPSSLLDFVEHELDIYVRYFRAHPNANRLWLDGRVSPTVRAEVLRQHHHTAARMQALATAAGLSSPDTDPLVFVMMVELSDRVLELAFRDRDEPDPQSISHGITALTAYLTAALRP
ncbi:TetR/AcrR family transcriptional regulator [Streptomyces coffeae]|uniref:TetR/AcrR family transcriptional regulator n=1 Tax=Streptomyces coffeae TaxID=621382 RepID=A0ABS1NCT0_9ACTN|nr:TetR/AcrR family transcriptional regulator [Streptomyces coffeae]MBL1097877.1 TetR/AcrR family transcriptional regulator [Streptomyces coffeae]